MKASDIRNLVILVLLTTAAAGYGASRYIHHQQWEHRYVGAREALASAWKSRDAAGAIFEPRWKVFEAANDHLKQVSGLASNDELARQRLDICGDNLRLYRSAGNGAADAVAHDLSPDSELDLQLRAAREVVSCFKVE